MPIETAGTTMTTTTNQIWVDWIGNTTHTATSNTSVWSLWSTASNAVTMIGQRAGLVTASELIEASAERMRERGEALERLRAEQARRAAVEREVAAEANARAEQLLLTMLTPEQRETYQRARYIIVVGRSGRRYRVRRGRVGNVDVIGANGHIESRLCAHPGIWTPDPDVMVAQLLHLQHDDDEFCRTANVHQVLANEGRILPPLAVAQ